MTASSEGDPPTDPSSDETGTTAFDAAGFARTYEAQLLARARAVVGPLGGDPEDVVQDVHVRLLKAGGIRTNADALAFFAVNLRWITTDNARRSRRTVAHAEFADHAGGIAPDPADEVTGRAFLEVCQSLLTSKQRSVWTAVEVHGLTRAEVGERFGMTADAVRATLHRAWDRLRENADLFRSMVASLVLIPPRRRASALARQEPGWFAAGTALAGLTLLASSGGAVVPPSAEATAPGFAQLAPRTRQAPGATRGAWPVREPHARRLRRAGAASSTASDDAAPASRPPKLARCVGPLACLGTPGSARAGHAVLIAVGGPVPQSYELSSDLIPVCDAVDPAVHAAPTQSAVSCERNGPAGPLPPGHAP